VPSDFRFCNVIQGSRLFIKSGRGFLSSLAKQKPVPASPCSLNATASSADTSAGARVAYLQKIERDGAADLAGAAKRSSSSSSEPSKPASEGFALGLAAGLSAPVPAVAALVFCGVAVCGGASAGGDAGADAGAVVGAAAGVVDKTGLGLEGALLPATFGLAVHFVAL
jgi:hypothetical protein